MSEYSYTSSDFLAAFDAPETDRTFIEAEMKPYNFSFARLGREERDAVILGILKNLDGFTQVGEHRHGIWTDAWGELAQRYYDGGGDLAALDPPFMGATPTLRINGDYARPLVSQFETHWFRVLRRWLFRTYLGEARRVAEFGCGSGFNLVTLAKMYPKAQLIGLDWAQPVVELMNDIGERHSLNITGRRFDFFNPDLGFDFGGPGNVAMTFCALEQTGERYDIFLDWLVERSPDLVVSMEPAIELYDENSLFDYMTIRYHTGRKYLNGYYTAVRRLAAEGRAEIIKERRLGFGSLYHEGYSLLIWRPLLR